MENQRNSTRMLVLMGMFAAVLAVLSQLQIPMPSGVPITMQTFAVALTGFVLGWKYGLGSVAVWILVGAVGVPVFTQLRGGIGILVSTTGGFIWGFLALSALCGYAYTKKAAALVGISLAGLAICHLAGVLQFAVVMDMGVGESFVMVSLPYIIKDAVSVAGAYLAAKAVRSGLNAAGIPVTGRA